MRALSLAFVIALAACGGKHADSPRQPAPALFASIPADTPYVLASFEAVPLEVLATYRDLFGGTLRGTLDQLDGEGSAGDPVVSRLVASFFAELDGKWTAAGVESLGLSARPRFALYGLGLFPVLRVEIRDGGRLFATIERIAARARVPLPPPETRDGRRFWRIENGGSVALIALTGDQLVVAYGPAARLDAELPLVLGIRRPAHNMADGAELAAARTKHRLGPHAVAIVDGKRLAAQLLAGTRPSPECTAAVDRLVSRAPRLVAGYAVGRTMHETALVLELAPDLIGELRAMRVELPGLAEAAAGQPLMMLAGGIDLPRAQALAVAAAEAIERTTAVCAASSMSRGAGAVAGFLARPMPAPVGQLRGVVLSLASIQLLPGPMPFPRALEGFALASSPGAARLFELVHEIAAGAAPLSLPADGKLHRLPPDLLRFQPPFALFAGATERVVGIAAGSQSTQRAERAMAAAPAPVPFFVIDGDYGRMLELKAQLGGKDQEMDAAMAKFYGRTHGDIDVTDRGLEMRATFETK